MKLSNLLAPLALTFALASSSAAQCLVPDNLDLAGATCMGAATSVPQASFAQKSLGICWRDCGVDASQQYVASWGQLTPVMTNTTAGPQPSCAWYQTRLQLVKSTGLAWVGVLNVHYSRTWAESPTPGQIIQVWRYLVDGDLNSVGTNAMPCGTPACALPNGNRVRFTGYVDYAKVCGSPTVQRAWMLTHACDAIDHAPGFPRAGVFHPNRYYTFVGPSLGFVIGAGSTIEAGSTTLEAMRRWDASAMPARCAIEEPLVTCTNTPNAMICMCGTGPTNWYEGQLFVGGAFGSVLTSFPGSAPFRSFPVGQWTIPGTFPGVEEVRWNCNEALFVDCTGVGRQEFYYGATTAGGYPAYSLSSAAMPLPLTFVDQSNSALLPAGIATRNTPYRSDHILNLNF